MHEKSNKNEIRRIFSLLDSKIWIYFIIVIISSLNIAFGFNMVLAFIQKNVFDAFITGEQGFLTKAFLFAVVTFVIGVPLWMITQYTLRSINKKTITRTRVKLFQKIVKLPNSIFENNHSGDLVSRSTNDIKTIDPFFRIWISELIIGIFFGVGAISSIFVMDWRLGIIAFVIGISILITSFKFAKPLRVQSDLIQKSLSNTTENLINVIQGLPVTKMFQLEQMTQRYYERSNAEWVKSKVRHCNLISAYNALRTVFEGLRNIGTLILGLYFFLQGSGSIGIIVASIHLQANAGYFFSNLSNTVTGIQTSFSGAGRIFDLMDTENEEKSRQVLKKPEFVQSKKDSSIIEIQNLSFNYTSSKNLIQKINLQVSKGELIAFVGESGGGKSTLIKLLLGLYPISSGNIMIQNRSIKEYTLTELRERTSYVPQNAFLFDGTIEDNIQYGNSHATKDEIIEAAKAAYAHDFIIQQKDGYNTLVGERGTHLSGGQRQRIAIARALLKNAPILLLDEATSALDSESEQLVQKALNSLMYGRTTLAVAHRLSTILHADNIYVIEEGQIMELGTHTELMNQGGKYEKLYNSQFGPSTI